MLRSYPEVAGRYTLLVLDDTPVGVHVRSVIDVVLLRGYDGQIFVFVAFVFAKFDPANDLLINEVGGHRVFRRIVPRRENLFPEK